jgi:IMP dehydrogenase
VVVVRLILILPFGGEKRARLDLQSFIHSTSPPPSLGLGLVLVLHPSRETASTSFALASLPVSCIMAMDQGDGFSAKQIFEDNNQCLGFTYDDVILMPATEQEGEKGGSGGSVSLGSYATRNIKLQVPLVSSPMDTVTESSMAIHMALHGGMGIVHYNMPVEDQAMHVRQVKRYKNGFITNPICLSPEHCVRDVQEIKMKYGYSGIPITEGGKMGSKLVGIVTGRDIDFIQDSSTPIRNVMSSTVVTATEPVTLKEANEILKTSKKGKLPVVNDQGELVALISRTDLIKNRDFPFATKDANKQLRCGAAIGTRLDDRIRCAALVEAGADVIVIDSSQGDSMYQHDIIKHIKKSEWLAARPLRPFWGSNYRIRFACPCHLQLIQEWMS